MVIPMQCRRKELCALTQCITMGFHRVLAFRSLRWRLVLLLPWRLMLELITITMRMVVESDRIPSPAPGRHQEAPHGSTRHVRRVVHRILAGKFHTSCCSSAAQCRVGIIRRRRIMWFTVTSAVYRLHTCRCPLSRCLRPQSCLRSTSLLCMQRCCTISAVQ